MTDPRAPYAKALRDAGLNFNRPGVVAAFDELMDKAGVAREAAPKTTRKLADPAAFFASARASFGSLTSTQVAGFESLTEAMADAGWGIAWAAYGLATPWHETGTKMQPNVESLNYSVDGLLKQFGRHRITVAQAQAMGRAPGRPADQVSIGNTIYGGAWGRTNLGNTEPGDGYKYRGRGLDHCTGRGNYAKVDAALGMGRKLLANPDLLLEGDNAQRALVTGMETGRYTGKKLADYLPKEEPATEAAFREARRIINALDKAAEIARHALRFQTALQRGRWV